MYHTWEQKYIQIRLTVIQCEYHLPIPPYPPSLITIPRPCAMFYAYQTPIAFKSKYVFKIWFDLTVNS